MDKALKLKKNRFSEFFSVMRGQGEVYAPVRVSEKSFSFKPVESPAEIAFEALRTILPPKKLFFIQRETLLRYEKDRIEEVKPEEKRQVLFGVHPCDLAGLGIMDEIYGAEPRDPHYLARREMTIVVGLSCMPDKHCFCKSMGTDSPREGYDLFLTELEEDYFIQVRNQRGLILINAAPDLFEEVDAPDKEAYKEYWSRRDKAFTRGFDGDNIQSLMDIEADNQLWEDLGNRCLSCGNCTPVCPTCYCFDVFDVPSLHAQQGDRVREWDSCQFVGFAKVAGDFNFRPGPVDRLKFWYRHKLHGFDDPAGIPTCVGCGRCTESCPSGIDDIVNVVLRLQGKPSELITDKPERKEED
ncbi:MAG: 4Fe-4S dicluster domain-containing protein [Candidatus Melainabacteria bacterium]|nr:4Fe-4S dicluster domain-containing protein [Candidatus Melainabacteria bacterium]